MVLAVTGWSELACGLSGDRIMIKVELNIILNTRDDDNVIDEIVASKMIEMPVCPVVGMQIGVRDTEGRIHIVLEVTTVYWDEGKDYIEAFFCDDRYYNKDVLEHLVANGWT